MKPLTKKLSIVAISLVLVGIVLLAFSRVGELAVTAKLYQPPIPHPESWVEVCPLDSKTSITKDADPGFNLVRCVNLESEEILWSNLCEVDNEVRIVFDEIQLNVVSCVYIEPTETPTVTSTPIITNTVTPEPTFTPTIIPTATPTPAEGSGFVIDHNSVDLFDQIPYEYLISAGNIPMMFSDRSVGGNIDTYLNCFTATRFGSALVYCRRHYDTPEMTTFKNYTQADYDAGNVPDVIKFSPDPIKYNRSNWNYEMKMGEWESLTQNFIEVMAPSYINSKDVLSYQFSYLNVDLGNIANLSTGYFYDNTSKYSITEYEDYISQHPDKTFIFWTTSLARNIGTQISDDFNNQMRSYAIDNNKILFDVADIESHDIQGNLCTDGGHSVICRDYTTETYGGHLGTVSGGGIKIAKAYWVLMARLAGWNP